MSWGIGDRVGVAVGIGNIASFLSKSIQSRSPQPTLNLDFAGTQSLGSLITFARSSTATYINSSGVITSAAIDVPRFGYDPSTLQSLGFLEEESRTNILLNSLLNGANLSTQTVTTTATPYTLSFYGTGTIVLTGTNISTQVGTGAYPSRKVFTFTPTAGALILTVTGTVQYAQLEVGSFATSFIPTAGSQVTRAIDTAILTGTNFSSWYTPGQGTIYCEASPFSLTNTIGNPNTILALSDNTTANRIRLVGASTVNGGIFESATGGTVQFALGSAFTPNTFVKMAGSYILNNASFSQAGGAAVTDTSCTIPTVTQMQIGNFLTNRDFSGYIKKISYYPTVFTAAQLQALTT